MHKCPRCTSSVNAVTLLDVGARSANLLSTLESQRDSIDKQDSPVLFITAGAMRDSVAPDVCVKYVRVGDGV